MRGTEKGDHEPRCNGICAMASDFIDCAPVGVVAYAHPECPLHGEDRRPEPSDGPDYHADLAAWKARHADD